MAKREQKMQQAPKPQVPQQEPPTPKKANIKMLTLGLILLTLIPLSLLLLSRKNTETKSSESPASQGAQAPETVVSEKVSESQTLQQDVKSGSEPNGSAAARLAAQAAALGQAHSGAASLSQVDPHVQAGAQAGSKTQGLAVGGATLPGGVAGNTGILGTPGLSGSHANSQGVGQMAKEAIAPPMQKGCFEITFKHKKMASHSDGEACLKHQNLITLKHPELNLATAFSPESLCVEVNGEAVRHQFVQGHPDQIMIGPYAGPNATITARACIEKSCQKKCHIKKDSFMAALGLQDGEAGVSGHVVGWNGSAQEGAEEAELAKEVKEVHQIVAKESLGRSGGTNGVFDSWIAEKFRASSCSKGVDHENHANQEGDKRHSKAKGLQVSRRDN